MLIRIKGATERVLSSWHSYQAPWHGSSVSLCAEKGHQNGESQLVSGIVIILTTPIRSYIEIGARLCQRCT